MKKIIAAFLWVLALPAFAADGTAGAQTEEKELADLLNIVQQETDVATKTRLNSDYVPGIVTVLEGDELEALGIRNAGEALGLVPGMQAMMNERGAASVIVRGLDFPFNAGNTQVLLNGIPVARQDGGFNTSVLMIPVEQIDRVEVIRGPGSVVYGDFAFMGLVNIITRKQGTRVAGRFEIPHTSRMAAARVGSKADAPFAWSFNASDFGSASTIAPSNLRGVQDGRSVIVANAAYRGLSLTAQSVHRTYAPNTGSHSKETTWDAEAKYTHELRKALTGELRVIRLHNDIAEPVDILSGGLSKISANLTWTGWRRQSLLGGLDYSRSGLDSAYHAPPPPPGQPPGNPVLFASDVHRVIRGVVLQDQIELNDATTLTVGGRYDDYSDLSSRFTPRISIVWRVNERHIVKAQYAEGFRPPTFFEFYQPVAPRFVPRYPFETNATSELNYVYRTSGRVGRATLFHSMLSDMIRPGGVVVKGDAWAQGAELEWSQEVGSRLKAGSNISYTETFDPRTPNGGGANLVSSKYLGNLMALYRVMPNLLIGARYNYVGDRATSKGYRTMDITISRQDLFVPGFGVRAGVKNGLDSDISYLNLRPSGELVTTRWPGRSVWLQVYWKQ